MSELTKLCQKVNSEDRAKFKGMKCENFLILEICYPFYVIIFGLASNFGTYNWKGRQS